MRHVKNGAIGDEMKNHEQEPDVERMEFLLDLRARGISNQSVLRAMDDVPRRDFVTADLVGQAYADRALPIACGQTISQPYLVAYMTEQLELRPHHRVLEVGTGSGYQAAVLSKLVQEVVSIERYRTLADEAKKRLTAIGCDNVQIVVGDGFLGVREKAPFDRIIVTAAVEEAPQALIDQLAVGGIMLVPIGPQRGVQHIVKLTKSEDWVARDDLIPVRFVPLVPGQAREL
jgi:protein-L-isoaspartate(D-aspartate) O-methyltransferase